MSAVIMAMTLNENYIAEAVVTLQWRHNELDGVSNHQPHALLLNRLCKGCSKKTLKPRATCLCGGIPRTKGQ